MEIYTKIFLANFIILAFSIAIDGIIFDNIVDKYAVSQWIGGFWILGTVISIPAWIVFAIFTS